LQACRSLIANLQTDIECRDKGKSAATEELRGILDETKSQLAFKEEELESCKLALANLESEVGDLRRHKDKSAGILTEIEQECDGQLGCITQLEADIVSEVEFISKTLENLAGNHNQVKSDFEHQTSFNSELERKLESLRSESEQLKKNLGERQRLESEGKSQSEDMIVSLQWKVAELESELQLLQAASEAMSESHSAKASPLEGRPSPKDDVAWQKIDLDDKVAKLQAELDDKMTYEGELGKVLDRLSLCIHDKDIPEGLVKDLVGQVGSPLSDHLFKLTHSIQDALGDDENKGKKVEMPAERPPEMGAMVDELVKQKTDLQQENSYLIGELTESKILLAQMRSALDEKCVSLARLQKKQGLK